MSENLPQAPQGKFVQNLTCKNYLQVQNEYKR